MEPLDPAKNDENSGFSKRRISSILKAPRKSIVFPNPEQQENVVECAKPGEKRNSRRVSFAPANDVLLFSNDVKKASPTQNPLQDLMTTAAAATNRVQVGFAEDGIQQIAGMETLLNAPLHASQQRDTVNCDVGSDFGEKTVMFSTDDAFMDMTQSQTINIASDKEILADISLQSNDILPTSGETTVAFTTNDGSVDLTQSHTANIASGIVSLPTSRSKDLSSEKTKIQSSAPCLVPNFENFLSSLFKRSGPSINPVTTNVTLPAAASSEETIRSSAPIKTQRADVDKENQAPASLSAVMEKSLTASRRTGGSSYLSALYPKDDVSMDMTETQTGHIRGVADDGNRFQSLFPSRGSFSHLDNRVSLTAEGTTQQQGSKNPASFNTNVVDLISSNNPPLHAPYQHMAKLDRKDDREKTIVFTAGDEFMDMTQSHTVNISSGLTASASPNRVKMDKASSLQKKRRETCGPPSSSANSLDPGFPNFPSSILRTSAPSGYPVIARVAPPDAASSQETISTNMSQQKMGVGKENPSLNTTICPLNDVSMEMTETQTDCIVGLSGSDDLFQFIHPTQDMNPHCESLKRAEMALGEKKREAPASSNSAVLETSLKSSLKTNVQTDQVKVDAEGDKTVRFSIDDACMDVTQSHTVNIATGFATQDLYPQTGWLKKAERPSRQQNSEALGSSNNKGMEPTSSKMKVQRHEVNDCRERTVKFTADEACMDMTRSHTVNIARDIEFNSHQNMDFLPACGEKTVRFTASDAAMDVTQCHTVNIATGFGPQSHHYVDYLPAGGEKTVRFTANEARMDMTQSHTVNIATDFKLQSHHRMDSLPALGEKTVRFTANEACMDMTQSHTVNIASDLKQQSHHNMDSLPACGEKTVRFTANEACMDMTQSHTVNIASDLKLHSHQSIETLPAGGEKTVRFTANEACMDMTQSHTVNIASDLKLHSHQSIETLPAGGEKTVRFTSNEACMDMTQSHTVNIASDLKLHSHQSIETLPAGGEKTVRFTANEACMDMMQSHTVNITTDLKQQSHHNLDVLPAGGEKTVRFTANEACMDMTQSHTVNIASDLKLHSHQSIESLPALGEKTARFTANGAAMDVTQRLTTNIVRDLELHSHQNMDSLPALGEKTMRFTANEACMDMTQSHTVNIASDLKLHSHQSIDSLPACGEKTVRFTAKDVAMDVTESHTGSIAPDFDAQEHQNVDGLSSRREEAVKFTANDAAVDVMDSCTVNTVRKRGSETCHPQRSQSSSTFNLDPGFKVCLSKITDPLVIPVITKASSAAPREAVDTSGFLDQPTTPRPDVDTTKETSGFVHCPEDSVRMSMTAAQTGQTRTDDPPECSSSTQSLQSNSDHLDKTEVTSPQSNVALETTSLKGVEITNRTDYLDSSEADNRKEPEPRNLTPSPNTVDHVDAEPSRKSRRVSLADLHSKIRRLSHMISTAPETVATERCTLPLPQLEQDADRNSEDKTKSLPVMEPEPQIGFENAEENTQARCLIEEKQPSITNTQAPCLIEEQPPTADTTPFNSKTVQLMSRLSVGGFKAKLPERSKPDDSKKPQSVEEHTRTMTVDVTNQLSDIDRDVSDIYDEELGSCEDVSEMLDIRTPQKTFEKMSPPLECHMDGPSEDRAFEEAPISAVHGKKRLLPEDGNHIENEKKMKRSAESATDFEMGSQTPLAECDSNVTSAPCTMTQTTDDSSSSQTASIRCEATFESTFKQSLFESQLEDYASDLQRKFDDGTVTVLEFFKLFNIDFVIHNPRQSVRPEKLLSDTNLTPMDLLKERHIYYPKQMVYETDVTGLTEKVEELKERKRDLDKPLKLVNKPLWEDLRNLSEKELKSFGAKLKERNNLFRKASKVQSHEMKEALYSNIVLANLEEQQRLRGTIEKANEMLKSLDDCIHGLEAELAAVEEKGFENTPSLKSRQEEMKKVTEVLADNDRQMAELEMEKKQNSKKLNKLKAETRNLESHINTLHLVNEWRFGENTEDCAVYTFLHETFLLQLTYGDSNGNGADDQSERKISQITFKQQFDVETSQDHACLVHKLLSQYVEGEAAWVEKYPTSRYVPQLLHDVGLVVGRCRLLGEELRLLKMWGGLKLDVLDISCVDTRVHIVFSSLKKFSKFEVIFSVGLTNQLCVLQVENFNNVIGSTTIQKVEEIVASFSPGRNLLTKIIKKIHETLLC